MSIRVEKVRSTGNERVFLTERGSSFGYNNLVVDFRSLAIMRRPAPVVFVDSLRAAALRCRWRQRRPAGVHPAAARAAVAAGIEASSSKSTTTRQR